jgi:hypothetical protein
MVAEVMRITNGHGARVAFDPVGGADFPKLIAALTYQGIVYIYGALSEDDTQIPAPGDDPQDGNGQGVQHPAGHRRRGTPESRGGVRYQGACEWRSHAGHRSHIQVRRYGGSAPLSGEQRPIRQDRRYALSDHEPSSEAASPGIDARRRVALAVVLSGIFVTVMDSSIVNVAIPVIREAHCTPASARPNSR